MLHARVLIMAAGVAVVLAPARSVHAAWWGQVGGGVYAPLAGTADRLDPGAGLSLGIGYRPGGGRFGLLLEGAYAGHALSQESRDALRTLNGDVTLWSLGLNGTFTPAQRGPARGYLVGGGGAYALRALAWQPTYADASGCDPWWWGWCDSGAPAAGQVLGRATTTRFGLDGGAGVALDTGNRTQLYLEARFHHVFLEEGRSAQFFPVQGGLRW